MVDIHKVIGKIPFKPKKALFYQRHRFTGPYYPLHLQLDPQDNPLPGNEQYNVVELFLCAMTFAIQLVNMNVIVKC